MKNFKLLLATTAILSTGLAMSVLADASLEGKEGTGYARIDAKATFTSPIRLTASNPIYFGLLDPKKGGEVTIEAKFVNPTVTDTKNAIITGAGSIYPQHAGSIMLTGGGLSDDMGDIEDAIADNSTYTSNDPENPHPLEGQSKAGSYIQLALEGETIALTETDTSAGSTADSTKTCGTVKNLTQGMPRVNGTGADRELEIPLGGTLEINQNYNPSGNWGGCSGHTTVTYVINNPW